VVIYFRAFYVKGTNSFVKILSFQCWRKETNQEWILKNCT